MEGELWAGIGDVVVVVLPGSEAGLGSTRLLSCVNGLLPAADGSDGVDGIDAVVGMDGAAGASRLAGTVSSAGAAAIVVGWEGAESEADGLLGRDDGPLTVGAAS